MFTMIEWPHELSHDWLHPILFNNWNHPTPYYNFFTSCKSHFVNFTEKAQMLYGALKWKPFKNLSLNLGETL